MREDPAGTSLALSLWYTRRNSDPRHQISLPHGCLSPLPRVSIKEMAPTSGAILVSACVCGGLQKLQVFPWDSQREPVLYCFENTNTLVYQSIFRRENNCGDQVVPFIL